MSGTGIVRRMDELGRIVIPKEMRRAMRLNVGDEMEIFAEGESILLRKHSRFAALKHAAERLTAAVADITGCDVLLVAADVIEAAGGKSRRRMEGKRVSAELASLCAGREEKTVKAEGGFVPSDGTTLGAREAMSLPVRSGGDVVGHIVVFGEGVAQWRNCVGLAAGVLGALCE